MARNAIKSDFSDIQNGAGGHSVKIKKKSFVFI